MSLDKRVVPVLIRGLDQRGPKQTAIIGEFENIRNMVIIKGNEGGYELVPRPGTSALSKTADVGSITTGMRLATLGSALVLLTGTSCYRKAIDGWHRVDATAPVVGVTTEPTGANSLSWDSSDAVYVNGYTVAAEVVQATVTTKSVVVKVTDANGAPVLRSTLETGDLGGVRMVVSGGLAVIFWRLTTGTGNIRAAKFDSAAPSTVGAPINITATMSLLLSPVVDVQRTPAGDIAIAFNNTGGQLRQRLLTPSTMTLGPQVDYPGVVDSFFGYLTNNFSSNVLYLAHVSANGLQVSTFDSVTLALGATTTYDASITADVEGISGYRAGAAVSVYVSMTGTGRVYDPQIRLSTGGAATTVMRSVGLASRVLSANGTLYALVQYRSAATFALPTFAVKGTCFLVDLLTQKAIGEALPDKAASPVRFGNLPNLATAQNSNTWMTSSSQVLSFSTQGASIALYTGSAVIRFTYQDATVGKPVELNGVLHVPGSLPYIYDGATLTESGFPIGPEPSATATPAPGGGMTSGHIYAYSHVLEWPDAAGNLYRSVPTAEFQVVMGAADTQVTHSIPSLRLTRKTGVVIATYRRNLTANETIPRRVSSSTAPTFNDPTADRVTFVDQVSDLTAASGEPLYTEGEILENLAPPPCRSMAVHRGRLLVAGIAGDQAAIWFSKDVVPGFGVAFSDALVSRLSTSEAVTAIGSMDSYAVACTGVNAGSTWSSSNDYPDDTGNGGVLKFEHQSGSVGCPSPMLMARTDDGLVVWAGTEGSTQSGLKGPYLITRGLSFEQVGTAIEDDAKLMTPAVVLGIPSRNQARFYGSSSDVAATVGVALVRESFFKTWARWDYTQQPAAVVDATVWQGGAAVLTSDGTVYTETLGDTVFDDLGVPASVPHRLDVLAFNFSGVAGYSRVYLGQLTGKVKGAGATFTMSVVQTADGAAMAAKTRQITGQAADSALDLEWDPGPNGKCSAYALRISDSGNTANAAWSLAAITMVVGTKAGANKLAPARRMT